MMNAAALRSACLRRCHPSSWRASSSVSVASFHSLFTPDDDKKKADADETTTTTTTTTTLTEKEVTSLPPWRDPAMRHYMFWNRETHTDQAGKYFSLIEFSPESIQREARILSLSDENDQPNKALHDGTLPSGSSLLAIGTSVQDFETKLLSSSKASSKNGSTPPNVLFVSPSCPRAADVLPEVIDAYPSIEWVHCRSAGIDFVESGTLGDITTARNIKVTNAKGQFSSSLAEYTMFACSYFAKDLPRLMRQQQAKNWEKYNVEELRGKTLGIVGYGDIGRACAKLASHYGMRIVALRRHPFLSRDDPYCNKVYDRSNDSLRKLFAESDYIVCSAPSTVETRGMVNAAAFESVKDDAVFINLGRGPVVDEEALIRALQHEGGKLKGAALDVFIEEPLPVASPLWDLPNILISPHNMDQTSTFMHEATEFFVKENLPRFLCGEELLNPVDPVSGY